MSTGYTDIKCICAIPLTPRKMFFAVRKDKIRKKILYAPSRKLVDMINKTMVHQAYDWVIGTDSSQASMIKEHFGKSRKPPLNLKSV